MLFTQNKGLNFHHYNNQTLLYLALTLKLHPAYDCAILKTFWSMNYAEVHTRYTVQTQKHRSDETA